MTLPLPAPGPRKQAICAMVPPCPLAAEIGADHGIISAHLLRQGVCAHMLVADISAPSLAKAQRLFALHGLCARATFRVADGLAALDKPVDAIVIAGMGARTVQRMLRGGAAHVGQAALIVQVNQDVAGMRRWLAQNGYQIDAEALVRDDGRYYVILRAARGRAHYTDRELLLGPILCRTRPPLYAPYLRWRQACLRVMRDEGSRAALTIIEEELSCLCPAPLPRSTT